MIPSRGYFPLTHDYEDDVMLIHRERSMVPPSLRLGACYHRVHCTRVVCVLCLILHAPAEVHSPYSRQQTSSSSFFWTSRGGGWMGSTGSQSKHITHGPNGTLFPLRESLLLLQCSPRTTTSGILLLLVVVCTALLALPSPGGYASVEDATL